MAFVKNRRLLLWLTISLVASLGNHSKAQSTSTSTSLAINKQVDKAKANLGDTLSYIVTLTNNGSSTVNNINVRDSLGLGLRYLSNSLNSPSGSNFNQGNPVSIWSINSLNAGQSIRLTYQAVADSMGILYARATIPGATVGICTSIPVKVCPGTTISSLLTAPTGRNGYHWFKNGVEITDQTTNVLYISSTGTYSVNIDNGNDQCNDISCCNLVIEEDPIPTFQAQTVATSCDGNTPQANGQIILTNFNSIHTYQYSEGSSFNTGASLSGTPKRIPTNGIIASNLSNPSGNKQYTIRVYNTAGCYTDYTVTLTPTTCSAQPKLAVALTPGACDAASNLYSVSGTISLTAAIAGTLTITDGNATTTVSIANGQTSAPFTLGGLTSGTGNHTVSIAGNGYTTISSIYSAPASCNPNPPTNTAPTVANVLAPQSATVGQAFSYAIPTNTFTDQETPNNLTVTVNGLPSGLSFTAPATISGTPSTTAGSPVTITVTATDAGGLSVSTPLVLTLYPVTNPGTFAITSVNTLTCVSVSTTQRQITFQPVYSGVDGSAITFTVLNELAATTNSGPYTIRLYTDNPVVTLQAQQSGKQATYSYNWLASCSTQPTNTAPTVANALAPQSATVGQAFSYAIPTNTFTDQETPNSLTISVAGLANGLSFSAPATISGTPSTTVGSPLTLTVTATDAGGLSVSTPLLVSIAPAAVTNPTPFTITAVNTLSCVALSTTQRQITFQPTYAGVDGTAITLSAVGALASTTATGPYTVQLYTDNPTITLQAQQTGKTATYSYNWLASCGTQPTNTAPTVANALAPQSATVGQAFSYAIPINTFTDKETPNSLTISVTGLTNGLAFTAPATISGTPSTTVGSPLTLTVTATDAGGLAVSTPLLVSIAPAPTPTNTAPTVANVLAPQSATIGQAFSYAIPANTFTDKETPNSLTISVTGLANGLAFTAPATISGTPSTTVGSPLTLTVTATDAGGLAVSTPLLVSIAPAAVTNTAPTVANVLAPQSATVGQAFSYAIPTNTFTDKETPNSLTISVTGLANGLSFSAPATISGTPSTTVGSPLTLTVTATDAGGLAVSTPLLVSIAPAAVTNPTPFTITAVNTLSCVALSTTQRQITFQPTYAGVDGTAITLSAVGALASTTATGPYTVQLYTDNPTITLQAQQTGKTATYSYNWLASCSTQPTNTAPTVANALAPQSATVGQAFSYAIPTNTFTDQETPNSLTISVAGLANGLSFSAPATISGTPSTTVGSPLTLTVTATDAGGLAVSTPLLVSIAPAAVTNTAPTVANVLAPQSATIGQAFSYAIPTNTFTDKETPNSLTISVAGLTNGLAFTAPATISGTPSTTVGSPLTLTVTATDAGGLAVSTPLLVSIAPAAVTNPTPFTITAVNTLSCVALSTTQRQITFQPTYAGVDGTAITLSAVGALASTTATGPYTVQLYTDNPTITLQAQQTGKTATYSYNWLASCSTQPTNTAPTVANALAPQSATVGQAFSYAIPTNTFTDKETPNSLTISVTGLANGLSFSAPATISGTPSTTVGSPLTLTVTATDAGGLAVSTPLLVSIAPAPTPTNTAPTVANALAPQSATVGQAFSYAIPANTFTDQETPNSLTISVAGLANGLSFSAPATISGTPSTTVGSPLTLTVTATDAGGLAVSTPLLVSIAPAAVTNTAPTVANALAPQSATIGQAFSYAIPANTFTDKETPNSLTISVAGLTNGLAFTAPATISGTPSTTVGSPLTLTVTATDAGGLAVSTPLLVSIAPAAVTNPTPFTITAVNTLSCVALSTTQRQITFQPTYAGVDGSPVSFSVVNELVPTTNPGPYTLKLYTDNPIITLQAQQAGKTASFKYSWLASCEAAPANTAPTVANVLAPQSATVGQAFSYAIPANTFTDQETPNSLTISVAGLTNGLAFTAPATISGTPSTTVGSPLTLTVTATDAGGLAVSTPLLVSIAPAPTPTNTAPTVANVLAPQSATIGQAFSYAIPANTFTDKETPNSLTISVAGLANGLSFSAPATISGTPSTTVGSPLTLTVTATDAGGLAVSTPLLVSIAPAAVTNTAPTVANALAPQSATIGQAFSYAIPANTFTDKETPNSLTISVTGLANGLSFSAPATISGTPSTTVGSPLTLTVTATDAGGLAVSTPLLVSIAPAPTPTNTAPTVANALAPQSATIGQAFSYAIPTNTFTDQETPNSLTISVAGLTSGLAFTAPATISGTPSTTVGSPLTLTVTATDAGGLAVSTPLLVSIAPAAVTNPTPFTITAVNTLSCVALSTTQRQITFQPTYAGVDGSPVSFSVVNELVPTTNPGPYTLKLYTDNPIITLQAQQSGAAASYKYSWLASCGNTGAPVPTNTAPTVANALAPQSATIGQAFSYAIPANTFTDQETPNSLTISVTGLTNGLAFTAPATISGTPSTTVGSPLTLTVTATDAGGLSVSTPLLVSIAPAPAPTNTAPTVANVLAPQSATIGQAFSYAIPTNTFTDKETPNSLTISVVGLTNGLAFTAPATISGTPSTTVGSPLTLTVTATDAGGLAVSTPLLVSIAPAAVTNPTPFTITAVNTLSCVALSTTQRQITFQPTYAGVDGSPVSFSVVNELVPTTNPGPYTLKLYTDNPIITLQAQQSGAAASYKYSWLASCGNTGAPVPTNTAPTVANALAPQSATVGQAFSYAIPTNTFTDQETPNSLTISVAGLANGLSFSAPATISGTPSTTVGSPLTLTVTATDAGGLAVSTPLLVSIAPAPTPTNTAPTVANALAPQSATVGQAFSYAIPANTFTDQETPNSLTISVTGLTNGLAFTAPATISGTPSTTVGSPLTLTVTATDAGGLAVSTPLLVSIAPAAVTNPTPFTITAVNTLSCVALSTTQRQITFQPTYAGVDGSPVSFSVVNELVPTTNPGPYTLKLYTDNPIITLQAQQSGAAASYKYSWLASCGNNSAPGNSAPTAASAITVTATPGPCDPATNQYVITGTINLTAASTGTLLVTDGTSTTTVTILDGQTLARFTLAGLLSGTGSHTVTITGTDYPTASATYSAPESCTIGVAISATAGACNAVSNQYDVSGVFSLTNAQNGIATLTDGAYSTTIAVSAGDQSVPYSLTGLLSGTGDHTITVDYLSHIASTTYTAPGSCTVSAICSLTTTVTPGVCDNTTNTYSATAVVSISNSTTGVMTVSNGTQSFTFATTVTPSATFTAVFDGLISDGASHTIVASLPDCSTLVTGYVAPTSCTQTVGSQLSLLKQVDKSKAYAGDTLSYTLVLTNNSNATVTNVTVRDSATIGLTYVANSATAPTGTTFATGASVNTWLIGSISPAQSLTLTLKARADSTGILHSTATIPGDTATVCTTIPVKVCAGDEYLYRLTAPLGYSTYQWYKDGQAILGATTNSLDVSTPGSYSLAVDNAVGQCPDFSCCPFIIEEDSLPTFQAVAVAATCIGNKPQANAQLVLSNFQTGYTYQYSAGATFDETSPLSGSAQVIPANGIIANTLLSPAVAQAYTIRVYNSSGCYTDVTVMLQPTVCGCPAEICVPFVIQQTKRGPRIGEVR